MHLKTVLTFFIFSSLAVARLHGTDIYHHKCLNYDSRFFFFTYKIEESGCTLTCYWLGGPDKEYFDETISHSFFADGVNCIDHLHTCQKGKCKANSNESTTNTIKTATENTVEIIKVNTMTTARNTSRTKLVIPMTTTTTSATTTLSEPAKISKINQVTPAYLELTTPVISPSMYGIVKVTIYDGYFKVQDGKSKGDPYIIIKRNGEREVGRTSIKRNSHHVTYNQQFLMQELWRREDHMTLTVWDADQWLDDEIDKLSISLKVIIYHCNGEILTQRFHSGNWLRFNVTWSNVS